MMPLLKGLIEDESGQDLIEWGLIAAMVGLGSTAVMKSYNIDIGVVFNRIGTQLTNATQ